MTDNIIIDTDPGIDDSLALIYAYVQNLPIKAIATVYGNSSLRNVTRNCGFIVKALGVAWPIYEGSDRPLTGSPRLAESHGKVGLGKLHPKDLEIVLPESTKASELFKLLKPRKGGWTLLCLGPLTNIARAINEDPEFIGKISQLVIMGGSFSGRGNVTEFAEFNTYNDPGALEIVLTAVAKSKADTTIIPIELCRQVLLTKDDLSVVETASRLPNIRQIVEPFIDYYLNDSRHGGYPGAVMYDLLVPLYYQHPQLFKSINALIKVNTLSKEHYGQTTYAPDPLSTIKICTEIKQEESKKIIMQALTRG